MKTWYAAHLVLYVEKKTKGQRRFPAWENIVLIQANSDEEALAKAEERGRQDAGADESFRWSGVPARWVFAGVRQLIRCVDEKQRPGDGTEVTYNEMEFTSREEIERFVDGRAATVRFPAETEPEPAAAKKGSEVNGIGVKARRS